MDIIDIVFGSFFGYVMRQCYELTNSFGWAVVIFTLLTKVIIFPISLMSQKNSIIMVKIQPMLADLQARYEGELDILLKEQKALYKKEKYSALKALLPLLIQIPLIIGVISVVNNPVRHLKEGIDSIFMGIDLFALPGNPFVPAVAIASTALLCVVQNFYNVISREQGFFGKWGVSIFLVAFTGWFSLICPAGVGLYWTYSNLFSIVVLAVCNIIYNPRKHIDYENRAVKHKLTKADRAAKHGRRKVEKAREKVDMKRFFSIEKEVVFFSESSGFYKYFQHFIDYIIEHSDITVHYLTADINDQVFALEKPQFETYFCSSHGLITTFMKIDSAIMVMTMADLEVYHYKRSLVRKDVEYIYTDHAQASFHLTYRKGAFDHYDTIFCYSKNHNEEIRVMERLYGTKEKKLINVGYGLLDVMISNYTAALEARGIECPEGKPPQILIAPSWQKDNILEYCLDPLLEGLFTLDYKVIVRPHPEFTKRFPGKIALIVKKYGGLPHDKFELQTDFSSNSTVYDSDLVITDWSAIAQEYSFTTKKPSLFVNTPMKVMNLEWRNIGIEPMEIWIRDRIGVSIDPDKLGGVADAVNKLLADNGAFKSAIESVLAEYMYNMGHTAEAGGEYIIGQIMNKRAKV